MKIEIRNRWTFAAQISCEIPDNTEECFRIRAAVEIAYMRGAVLSGADLRDAVLRDAVLRDADLRRADLRRADLRRADLSGAVLSGAVLSGADLRDAVLRDADLSGAVLSGADLSGKPATPQEAVANLDKVREIILDNAALLQMNHWHAEDSQWHDKTCIEEAMCGTTHCLAGWLQVCSTNPEIRKLDNTELAGILCAPVASKMFYETNDTVTQWLETRAYAKLP